jgi:photosystem II stability/assembly factor-like uncharacterized protein
MKRIIFLLLFLFSFSTCFSQTIWQQSNGPYTGTLINQLTINQSGHLFACSYGAGIFRSTDNGNSWVQINQGLPQLNFEGYRAMCIAGNGDIYESADNLGIYKSTNNGGTWFQTGFTQGIVNNIVSASNGYIFAGTPTGAGVYRTTNSGANWTHLENGLPVYLAVSTISIAPDGRIYVCRRTGVDSCVYTSSNYGVSWNGTNLVHFSAEVSTVNTSGHVFVAGEYNGVYTVYRSTNNGISWVQKGNGLPQCHYNSMYSSQNNELFISSDSGIYKSANNGDSWARINSEKYAYSFVKKQSGEYFISTIRKGVFKSSNNGSSWQSVNNGLSSTVCYGISISNNGYVYTGTLYAGAFRSTNNGSSWKKIWDANNRENVYMVFQIPNGYIFAGTDSGLYRSTNDGLNWNPVTYLHGINAYFINSNGHIFLGVGNYFYGIYRSTDNGSNWSILYFGHSVYSFAENSFGYMFAGTSDGIYRSTNNGTNWAKFGNLNEEVYSLVIVSNSTMFAGTRHNGLFKSTDFGNTWNCIWPEPEEVADLKYNQIGHLFAVIPYAGVYRSTNQGLNWTSFNSGLFNPFVFSLALNSNGYLYASTYGAGVYKTINSTIGIKTISSEIPQTYSLSQNYPNPFNPSTKIKFSLPKSSDVIIKVFDISGKEVEILVNQNLGAGIYETEWDGSDYSSGVYFYVLETGSYTETKKMVLLK